MRRSLVFVTLFLVMASAAHAQSLSHRGDNWEFSVQTRYTMAEDYSGEGESSLTIKEDLGWGFGFSYNFNKHFNLGMLFGWRSVPYEGTAVDAENPGETTRYSGEMTTSNMGISAEYNFLEGRFTPYVNGSLSWMHINTNVFAGWTTGCWWDPWWGYICGPVPLTYGTNTAAYTLGLGGRFEVSDKVFLRAGYERGWIGSGSFDGSDIMRIDLGFTL